MAEPLKFGGEVAFDDSPERVEAALRDLDIVAKILPDVESVQRIDANTVRCVVRPGFSFLRGKLTTTITQPEPTDTRNAGEIRYRADSKGVGVQVGVEATMQVATREPAGSGSILRWTAEVVQLSGLVAAVSKPLIRAAAEQVIARAWERLRAELSAGGAPSASANPAS